MTARHAARFLHPARQLAELPGARDQGDDAIAAWLGIAPAVYRGLRDRSETAVHQAGLRLARAPATRACLQALACRGGGRVVAFGDSLTADALSWAEILRHALQCEAATRSIELVNLGVSGDTTVHLVSRFAAVSSIDPDLLIVMVGTNDARRHGSSGRMLVPDRETRGNLDLLRMLTRAETRAKAVFVSPPPVLEDRIRRASQFKEERVTWLEAEVDRKAALVCALDDRVIDSRKAFSGPLGRLLLADGLHLSLRGQERLARWIVQCLAAPELRLV